MDKSSAPSEKFTAVSVTNNLQVKHVLDVNNGIDGKTPSLGFFGTSVPQIELDAAASLTTLIDALHAVGLFKQAPSNPEP
jgi:hypothetical protein